MTKVSYSLEPLGNLGTHVLHEGAFSADAVATGTGFFIADSRAPGGLTQTVFGRLFDGDGNPSGGAFLLSTNEGSNSDASSAVLTTGTLVTAYQNLEDSTVFMVLTDKEGTIIKPSFAVSTPARVQDEASVAALSDGGYVVTWTKHYDGGDNDINAQRYDRNGNEVGAEIGVDVTNSFSTNRSSVAGLAGGGFVVAFDKQPNAGGETNLVFRIFNPAGAVTTIIEADTSGTDNENATVIGLKDGGFAIAYESDGWNADTSGLDVTLQIFDAEGTARTGRVRVNSSNLSADGGNTAGDQDRPTLAQLKNGDILVGWETLSDATSSDIKARVIDLKGHAVTGIETLANSTMTEVDPSFATLGNGHVGVSWESFLNTDDNLVGGAIELVRTSVGTKQGETIKGDGITDHILGRGGDDKLYAGKGADTLTGGKGADQLYAGKGDAEDVFVFGKGHSKPDGQDRIFGFDAHAKNEQVSDKIDLSHLGITWGDVSVDKAGKDVTVLVNYKGNGDPDMIFQVAKVDDLHKADFIL